jgi:hypothetical protein
VIAGPLNFRNEGAKLTLAELEKDRGKCFALWSFLHMFGSAPDLAAAFKNEEDRDAARNFMDLLAASEDDGLS